MARHLDDNEVQAFFRGRLSQSQSAHVQAHVDQCSACRHLVAEVARTSSAERQNALTPGGEERVVIRDGKVTRRPQIDALRDPRRGDTPPPPRPGGKRRPLAPGDMLADRYRLDAILGEGGTGIVWEATHIVIRRRVALKVLKSSEEEATRRFFREARVTAALRHPHIVEVNDVFVVPETGTPAMVMELLEGAPLSSWLRPSSGPTAIGLRETARVLLPVVGAVGAAHSVGVVHRDLKPENVFLLGDSPQLTEPRVKVLDFGLAKLTATEGDVASTGQLTRSGFVLGTPHYMAPEQVATDAVIDPRTDVWAIGVMLYECIAGARPIEGQNLTQLFRAIAEPKIVPLAKRVPGTPKPIGKLASKMLSRDPKDRPGLEEIHDVLAAEA